MQMRHETTTGGGRIRVRYEHESGSHPRLTLVSQGALTLTAFNFANSERRLAACVQLNG
jgi:hypothetical protein